MSSRPRHDAKYATIAADLKARIRSGEYPQGTALPPQRALSSAYGVTLMTLRQALQVLADQGLIIQRAGKDTLVSPPQASYRLGTLRSLADDLRDQGYEVTTQVVSVGFRKALPLWVAEWFEDTDRALRVERVRLLDGRPVVHQVSWVREPYAHAVRERDLTTVSLYDALADAGGVVDRATETIRPGILGSHVAGLVRQPVGGPLLVSRRVTYQPDDSAVVVDRASIVGKLMEIRAQRSATRISVQWGHQGDGN